MAQWVPVRVGVRRTLIIAVHLGLWTAAFLLAFQLRFDFKVPTGFREMVGIWLPVLLAARVATFHQFGLFRGLWRYTGARDAIAITYATTLSSLGVLAFLVVAIRGFPRSVVAIEWLAALMLVGGPGSPSALSVRATCR
jgi:FlaA1/EpsC-like NDP-sugar epimerase